MQKKPVLCVFLCVHPELFQVSQFIPSPFMRLPFSNALQSLLSHFMCMRVYVCVSVCFPAVLSLFPPALVNVNASCCSSQTTSVRRTNLIAVATLCSGSKKEAREEKKGTFIPLNTHKFPLSPLPLCIAAQARTMWSISQASPLYCEMGAGVKDDWNY